MKFKYVHSLIIATTVFSSSIAMAASDTCPPPSKTWEDRYKKVAMDRAPSMFDECNPFSDIFISDFWSKWLDKLPGIGDFDFCGYNKDDLFEDGASAVGIDRDKLDINNVISEEIEEQVNKVVKPITKNDNSVGSGSNEIIKDIIFN